MARRNTTIIKCDGNGCMNYVEIDEKDQVGEGWYNLRVSAAERKFDNRTFDLCSLKCVIEWSKGRAEFTGESVGRTGKAGINAKRYPCPECEQLVGPQGFHLHWKHAHSETANISYDEALQLFRSGYQS